MLTISRHIFKRQIGKNLSLALSCSFFKHAGEQSNTQSHLDLLISFSLQIMGPEVLPATTRHQAGPWYLTVLRQTLATS